MNNYEKSNLMRKNSHVRTFIYTFSCDKDEFINSNSENSISTSGNTKENSKEIIIYGPEVEVGNGHAFLDTSGKQSDSFRNRCGNDF